MIPSSGSPLADFTRPFGPPSNLVWFWACAGSATATETAKARIAISPAAPRPHAIRLAIIPSLMCDSMAAGLPSRPQLEPATTHGQAIVLTAEQAARGYGRAI